MQWVLNEELPELILVWSTSALCKSSLATGYSAFRWCPDQAEPEVRGGTGFVGYVKYLFKGRKFGLVI